MDGNAAREDNRQVLKRIVALLFAFAALAERAGATRYVLRPSVLWILRYADTVARDFVMDTALENGAALTPAALLIPALHGGDGAADAMRLAENFRMLAVLLDRLADANPGRRQMCLTRMCIMLAAWAAGGHLSAGTRFERGQVCLAPPGFAIERRDSS